MSTFYRQQFDFVTLTLTANEPLGMLDSNYLENENGVDGYLTLYHVLTGQRFSVVMADVSSGNNHDTFYGQIALSALPDGDFEVRGRVRDLVGNYTVLSSVSSPLGGERVLPMTVTLRPGYGIFSGFPGLVATFGVQGERLFILPARGDLVLVQSLTTPLAVNRPKGQAISVAMLELAGVTCN